MAKRPPRQRTPPKPKPKSKSSGLGAFLRQHIRPRIKRVLRPELLLHPQLPKPMHSVAPREVLGNKWWNKERREAYRRSGYCCLACGIPKHKTAQGFLESHESYSIDYAKGRMTYVECVALCKKCHSYIHLGRMNALAAKGEIPMAVYVAIVLHGDRVLAAAGLHKPTCAEQERDAYEHELAGEVAAWSKWRLVVNVDGKQQLFPPKFKNLEQWKKAHGY